MGDRDIGDAWVRPFTTYWSCISDFVTHLLVCLFVFLPVFGFFLSLFYFNLFRDHIRSEPYLLRLIRKFR